LLIGHLVFAGVLGLRSAGLLQRLELSAYDLLLWTKAISVATDPRIVMVLASDEDQRQHGWPLEDTKLAQLFEIILAQNPSCIGLDLYRDQPVPFSGGPGYERLTQVFSNANNIIAVKKYQDKKGSKVEPPPVLMQKGQVGFNDIPTDSGGIVRRGLLYIQDDEGHAITSFGLNLALYYLKPHGIVPKSDPTNPFAVVLGKTSLEPLDTNFGGYINEDMGGFQFMLSYPGAPTGFSSLSVTQVLNQQFEPSRFKDKIVVIGVGAEATPDFVYTPFGLWLSGEQRIEGAIMHAYGISQLLKMSLGESKPLKSLNETEEKIWIWLWTITGALVCLWARSLWRFTLSMLSGILILAFLGYGTFASDIWILIAAPATGWVISFLLMLAHLSNQDKVQRAVLMQIFSKHVSKEVAQVIWQEREHYLTAGRLRSQRIIATVLFTDLQGFTTVSENMEAQALVDWLNHYMESMVSTVEYHEGQVNKFIGDSIMAVFGVPIPSVTPEAIARDAINAVDCALAMRQEIERLHDYWRQQGMPSARMRVGIFTGPLIVGSLGSKERQEYTVIGDTVNTASRLESYEKSVDADNICRILIGESTLQYLNEQFKTECVGKVYLKGKQLEVTIYRVVSRIQPRQSKDQQMTG